MVSSRMEHLEFQVIKWPLRSPCTPWDHQAVASIDLSSVFRYYCCNYYYLFNYGTSAKKSICCLLIEGFGKHHYPQISCNRLMWIMEPRQHRFKWSTTNDTFSVVNSFPLVNSWVSGDDFPIIDDAMGCLLGLLLCGLIVKQDAMGVVVACTSLFWDDAKKL